MNFFNRVKEIFLSLVKKDYTPYLILSIPLVFLLIFLFWPIINIILQAFVKRGSQLSFKELTMHNFRYFFTSTLYQRSLRNSFIVSFSVVFFTLLIGVPMGYFLARVDIKFKRLILSLGILPIITPAFVGAFSWIILLGRQGVLRYIINSVLGIFGISLPPIYGLFGVIFTMTITYLPFAILLSHGAFEAANPLLEESAMMMGAGRSRIIRTITLPLVLPSLGAAAILVFIRSMGNFGIPAMIGGQQYVLPTLIYFRVNGFWDLNGAAAIAIISVLITGLALYLQKKVVSAREYETISTASSEHKLFKKPGIKLLANLYCWIILLISILPQMTIFITSFFKKWMGFLPEGFTLNNYLMIPQVASGPIKNSLIYAIVASLLAAITGSLVAYITERRRPKGALLLDFVVMTPFILPGIVVV